MRIIGVGVNHAATPLALRERLAIAAPDLPARLARLRELAGEGFILSTCNRTEIIAVVEDAGSGEEALARFLAETGQVPRAALAPHLRMRADGDAVRHLFTIAAGLDSMILGEDQILMQLKMALDAAAQGLGPVLHRLGQMALATSKRVRAATAIGQGNLSIVSVALREAGQRLGDLAERSVLVVGAGDTAELVLKHLTKDRRARSGRIVVVNRTAERAEALAWRYGADATAWETRDEALALADLVVSCTAAPAPVFDAPAVARALAQRPERPLLCFDLAVPRDIAPEAAEVPGATVRDVDDLAAAGLASRQQRLAAVADAEAIVAAETARFLGWWRGRAVVPTIVALRGHAAAIRDAEVAQALARLPELTPREEDVVREMAAAIVNKLLHRPVKALQAAPTAGGMAHAVRELFALAESADALEGGQS